MDYQASSLDRAQVDGDSGLLVLDFGTEWCGHCCRTRPLTDSVLAIETGIRHLRIEDGPGRALGRSFRVKLWPTLIFLRNGREQTRLVRPQDAQELKDAIAALKAAP